MSRIRIGGRGRKPALSMNAPLPQISENAARLVDWELSLADAGFDPDETEFVLLTRIEGRTREEVATELGWTQKRSKAVQQRVWRKLAFGPVAPHLEPRIRRSSGIAFKLQLAPGHSIWDMTPPNPVEQFVLQLERTIFFSESST